MNLYETILKQGKVCGLLRLGELVIAHVYMQKMQWELIVKAWKEHVTKEQKISLFEWKRRGRKIHRDWIGELEWKIN